MNWNDTEILIIGGTGSLGKTLLKKLVTEYNPRGVRIYSRDELKQSELLQDVKACNKDKIPVGFLLGDIRDKSRLKMACSNVDLIINCSAMKQVPACENDPIEAIKTNVIGVSNLVEVALEQKVKKVLHISTDKAVYPVNLYGVSKSAGEKLIIHANNYRGRNCPTIFSCVRYGNVINSRGSIIPVFDKLSKCQNWLPITNFNMTRFWIELETVVQFILDRSDGMQGGEIFIPRMRAMKIVDLVSALWPDHEQREVGIRQGEKLHECLLTDEEMRQTIVYDNYYEVSPMLLKTKADVTKKGIYSDQCLDISKDEIESIVRH